MLAGAPVLASAIQTGMAQYLRRLWHCTANLQPLQEKNILIRLP